MKCNEGTVAMCTVKVHVVCCIVVLSSGAVN